MTESTGLDSSRTPDASADLAGGCSRSRGWMTAPDLVSTGEPQAMTTPLKWVSTPSLGQGRASGGSAAAELFEGGSAQRRRPLLETLVREVCQNSCDRRRGSDRARVFFDLLLVSGDERNRLLKALDWDGLRSHIAAVKGMGGAALTLRAGLDALEASTIICLRISDTNTEGLTGDDWDEEGNFRRLCIQNFSTGDEIGRGGSFGLGKAVSWMHSRILTVLFPPMSQVLRTRDYVSLVAVKYLLTKRKKAPGSTERILVLRRSVTEFRLLFHPGRLLLKHLISYWIELELRALGQHCSSPDSMSRTGKMRQILGSGIRRNSATISPRLPPNGSGLQSAGGDWRSRHVFSAQAQVPPPM